MKRCIVFTGGPLNDCDKITFEHQPEDLIIACDVGLRAARHFGVTPTLVVGDFDSLSEPPPTDMETLTVPTHKDDTDTMLGLQIGLERGCREFIIIGGLGGRLDHTVANLQLCLYLCEHGATVQLLANRSRVWTVRNDTLALACADMAGWYLSVLAWGGVCSGVTLEGLEYPLHNARVSPAVPLGVSNRFAADQARITVADGCLLVIASNEQ